MLRAGSTGDIAVPIRNTGDDAARGLVVTLRLPAGITARGGSGSDGWTCTPGAVTTCTLDDLDGGDQTTRARPGRRHRRCGARRHGLRQRPGRRRGEHPDPGRDARGAALRVQGRSEDQRDLLDVESVAGHLLKPGSVFAFLAEHRRELFPDEMFADLFPSGRGRPTVPADVMAAVIMLQALHGLSDAETVDAVTFDLRWKAAVRAAGHRGGVPSDDVDVLAAPAGRLGPAEPDLRRGQGGGRRRPGC